MYFKWSSCELHMKFICNYVWNIEVAMIFICISFEVHMTHRPELSNEISYEWYEPSVVHFLQGYCTGTGINIRLPIASKATLKDMGRYVTIDDKATTNKAKQNRAHTFNKCWCNQFPQTDFSVSVNMCIYYYYLYYYTPRNEVRGGGYIGFTLSVHLSVRLSVNFSCPPCSIYSSGWILSIFGTNDQ